MNDDGRRPGPVFPPPPGAMAGAPSLAVIPGGRGQLARPLFEPKPDEDFEKIVGYWKYGKKKRIAGEEKVLDWCSLKVYDMSQGPLYGTEVYVEDALDTNTDDADLVATVWKKCLDRVRMADDGIVHHFIVRCCFSDYAGADSYDDHAIRISLPKEYGQFGAQDVYNQSKHGQMLARHSHPHIALQEITFFDTLIQALRLTMDRQNQQSQRDESIIRSFTDREERLHARERQAELDLAAQEIRKLKTEALIKSINAIGARLAQTMPLLGVKLGQAAIEKLTGKAGTVTEREETAFETVCALADRLEQNGIKDPNELKKAFKAILKIDENDPIWSKLFKVLMEREVRASIRRAEENARELVPVEVILEEVKKGKDPLEVRLEPKEQKQEPKKQSPLHPSTNATASGSAESPDPHGANQDPKDESASRGAERRDCEDPQCSADGVGFVCDLLERLLGSKGIDVTNAEAVKFAMRMALSIEESDPMFDKLPPIIEELKRRRAARQEGA